MEVLIDSGPAVGLLLSFSLLLGLPRGSKGSGRGSHESWSLVSAGTYLPKNLGAWCPL